MTHTFLREWFAARSHVRHMFDNLSGDDCLVGLGGRAGDRSELAVMRTGCIKDWTRSKQGHRRQTAVLERCGFRSTFRPMCRLSWFEGHIVVERLENDSSRVKFVANSALQATPAGLFGLVSKSVGICVPLLDLLPQQTPGPCVEHL